jgi:hypothetical protein
MLNRITVDKSNHNQSFFRPNTAVDLRLYATGHHIDLKRPTRTIPHGDVLPSRRWLLFTPCFHVDKRHLSQCTFALIFEFDFQIANGCVARHCQKISFLQIAQSPSKPGRTPHFVIAANPAVQQILPLFGEHVEGMLVSCFILAMLLREACRFTAVAFGLNDPRVVASLGYWHFIIYRLISANIVSGFWQRAAAQSPAWQMPQSTAPLPRDSDAHFSLLRKRGRVENNHRVVSTERLPDLLCK